MLTPALITNRDEWNALLRDLPYAHILQSWEWGEFKQQTTGWTPERWAYRNAAGKTVALASLLTRRVASLSVMYVPKGAVLDYADHAVREAVLDHLQQAARARRAVWLKIDPDVPLGTGIPLDETPDPDQPPRDDPIGIDLRDSLLRRGWRFSADQVQFRNTLLLDLTQPEEALLKGMNQSTRRKLRQSEAGTVHLRSADLSGDDLRVLYELYTITGRRQGFVVRPLDYYRLAWRRFAEVGLARAWLAEVDQRAVAGLVLYTFGSRAWYFYGMSDDVGREGHPTYALQWQAIRAAKALGCTVYDWWGAPDHFRESDPMWGVYRFKAGFGGRVVRHIGAWDYTPRPFWYWLYTEAMPRLRKFVSTA